MNDYKELIDQVRTCIARGCDCCNQESTCKYDLTCNGIFDYHLACADAIEQLVKERDAAIADLRLTNPCIVCKHFSKENCGCDAFYECAVGENDLWEWRGVKK